MDRAERERLRAALERNVAASRPRVLSTGGGMDFASGAEPTVVAYPLAQIRALFDALDAAERRAEDAERRSAEYAQALANEFGHAVDGKEPG